MRYQYEYCGNSEYVSLHVSVKLTEKSFISNFDSESSELMNVLKGSLGATDISISPYTISAKRGRVFERDEVLDALLENLRVWLGVSGLLDEEWVKLPTLRSDIRLTQCPKCLMEQDRMMRESMKDFETLGD